MFWGHFDVTQHVHIPCDVTSPLLSQTEITQCILKQNKENTKESNQNLRMNIVSWNK